MSNLVLKINTQKQTQEIAAKIAGLLFGGEIIILEGDLGGGKTTFTKALAKALGVKDIVTSPTFVIKKIYLTKFNYNLEHLDLYRINKDEVYGDPTLLENLGYKDVVSVIEWGEKIKESIDHYLSIKFIYIDKKIRKLGFTSSGEKENKILDKISDDFSN